MSWNKAITNVLKTVAFVEDNAVNICFGLVAVWCAVDMLETVPDLLEHYDIIEGDI